VQFQSVHTYEVAVVMPAFRAAETIEATVARLPANSVQHLIVTDDASDDDLRTVVDRMRMEGRTIQFHEHPENRGYGGNQKTCYKSALLTGADVIVMVHPDGQYDPALLPHLVGFIEAGVVDIVLGSRILRRKDVLQGGMPVLKYLLNRLFTLLQNVILGYNLPEYHTGYRAYHRRVLERLNFDTFSEGFVFDQELLAAARVHDFKVGAVPVPTRYFEEASSIGFLDGATYLLGTLRVLAQFVLHQAGLLSSRFLEAQPE
jgi:glycosyltransferase involved in cell wall biosynthesis